MYCFSYSLLIFLVSCFLFSQELFIYDGQQSFVYSMHCEINGDLETDGDLSQRPSSVWVHMCACVCVMQGDSLSPGSNPPDSQRYSQLSDFHEHTRFHGGTPGHPAGGRRKASTYVKGMTNRKRLWYRARWGTLTVNLEVVQHCLWLGGLSLPNSGSSIRKPTMIANINTPLIRLLKKFSSKWGMVVHTCNPSTMEVKVGGSWV
jgi:hypothetical protein